MSIVPFFYQHFHDLSGKLAAAGRMHVYVAGSQIKKPIWSDVSMSIPRDNPMLLDGNGVAPQWFVGEGLVDIKVYTSTGSLIFTALNVSGTAASGQTPWPAASTGYLYFDEVSGVYSWRGAPGDHKVMVNANDTPTYLDQKLLGNGDLQWQEVEIEPGVWGMRAVINTAGLPGIETLTLLPPSHMEFRQLSTDPKNPRFLLEWTGSANDLVKTDGNSIAKNSLEPALGNPTDDGMVLASQRLGARYWRKLLESIGLSLGPAMEAIADVTNSPITEDGNIGLELADQPSGKALMSPMSGTGKPSFRTVEFPRLQYAASDPTYLYPNAGDQYMIGTYGSTLVGAFVGHGGDIAEWTGSAWEFTSIPGNPVLVTKSNQVFYRRYGSWFLYWTYSDNYGTQFMDFSGTPLYCKEARDYSGSARWTLNEYGLEIRTGLTGTNFLSASINLSGHGNFSSVRTGTPSYPSVWTERINALGNGFLTSLSISGLTNGTIPLVSTAGGLLGNSSLSEDVGSVKSAKPLTINGATRPAWGAAFAGATQITNEIAIVPYSSIGPQAMQLWANAFYDGAYRAVTTYAGQGYPTRLNVFNGVLEFSASQENPVAGGIIPDLLERFSVDRFGQTRQFASELVTSGRYVKTTDTTIGPSATTKASLLNGATTGFAVVTDPAQRWNAVGAKSKTELEGVVSSTANQVLVFELYRNGAVSATLTVPARTYDTVTPWRLVIKQTVRVAGASGTVRVLMRFYATADSVNSAASCYTMDATLTGIDLTASHTWDVVCTIPNDASNQITCQDAEKIG